MIRKKIIDLPIQQSTLNKKSSPDSKEFNFPRSIIEIKPNKLNIKDFQCNKTYIEKVEIKNLLECQLILTLRSSDTKRMEVNEKNLKLKAFQSGVIELIIREPKEEYHGQKKVKSRKLYMWIKNDFVDEKFLIELIYVHDNSNESNKPNDNLMPTQNDIQPSNLDEYYTELQCKINKNMENLNLLKNTSVPFYEDNPFTPEHQVELSFPTLSKKLTHDQFCIENLIQFQYQPSLKSGILASYEKEKRELESQMQKLMSKCREMEELLEAWSKIVNENNEDFLKVKKKFIEIQLENFHENKTLAGSIEHFLQRCFDLLVLFKQRTSFDMSLHKLEECFTRFLVDFSHVVHTEYLTEPQIMRKVSTFAKDPIHIKKDFELFLHDIQNRNRTQLEISRYIVDNKILMLENSILSKQVNSLVAKSECMASETGKRISTGFLSERTNVLDELRNEADYYENEFYSYHKEEEDF